MTPEPILKFYDADDLRPAQTTRKPAIGDLVQMQLMDGSEGAEGIVIGLLGDGWTKVRVEPFGNFAVAAGRLTVLEGE